MIIGYPIYWLELYLFRASYGKTTPLVWLLFCFFTLIVFSQNHHRVVIGVRSFLIWFAQESLLVRLLLILMGIGAGAMLLSAFYASLLPPHLIQEFDALNYHFTLPRQHLLLSSFSHIPWSTADLYFLPIDFALAPFWLATSLPNKLPQFIFVLGLLGVCSRLAFRFSGGKIWPSALLVLAILGSHNIGIQMGTAMLDIVICYLFLAALDSFLSGAIWLGVVELSFYVWSKPLIPIQFLVTIAIFGLIWLFLWVLGIRKNVWATSDDKNKEFAGGARCVFTKGISLFLIVSLFVSAPFIFKSLRYSGTPIFPLGVGVFQGLSIPQSPERWVELKLKAAELLAVRDNYGSGRSLIEFVRHLWFIAVPEKGVNNRYDYPLGLMYLLFVGPFLFFFIYALRRKCVPLLSLWAIASWVVWWMGTQQTRFLFIPLILIYLVVALSIRVPSRILLSVMLVAILSVSISVYRANKPDFWRWGEDVLRQQDKELIRLGRAQQSSSRVTLPFYDVAYATCPVEVIDNESLFVLKTASGENK